MRPANKPRSSYSHGPANLAAIKALTFLMFMMFAMTTDSVGVIIPGDHQAVRPQL